MGPLKGIRIVELAGIGPAPMCAMLLADLGADVIRVDRMIDAGFRLQREARFDLLNRGRPSIGVDLKQAEGRETVLKLVAQADGLIEGFRPGVMERLGLGPQDCAERNPRLVYGRMTGWGQDGPIAHAAGHDINYIALTGALHAIGSADGRPIHPLNLVGDFGGGALYLALGMLAGIIEARGSGRGQVVDAAMTDGAASLMTMFYGMLAAGQWHDGREQNVVDGGSHFYRTYATKDGRYVAVGAIEAKFYAELLDKAGLADATLPGQFERAQWPDMAARLSAIFKTRTRDEWCALMEGSDVCFAPVLSLHEAPQHPQIQARDTFIEIDGVVQPAPAPRFSRTPGAVQRPPPERGANTDEALAAWGFSAPEVARLRADGAVG